MNKIEKQNQAVRIFYNTGGNIKRTCESLGIKRMIFYRWLKEKRFKQRIDYQIEKLHDNLLSLCYPVLDIIKVTSVKRYYRKGKYLKTITTTSEKWYPNRVVLKAIITIFKIFARRGNERAMEWCGGVDKFSQIKQQCKVFSLPRELRNPNIYRIAA
jgi:hypothetical protein